MEKPPLPPRPSDEKPRGSFLSIALAFSLLTFVGLVLFFLTLGTIGPVVVIGLVIFFLIAFHYLVWGWWLGRAIREESEDDDADS